MDYSDRSAFFRIALAGFVLALPACDKGSVGEFESETDSGTGSGSDSDSDSESASTSGSESASTSGSASDSASTTGVSASDSDSAVTSATTSSSESDSDSATESDSATTGPTACEGSENHLCSGPVDCGDACGTLDSFFDDEGCIRPACGRHDECGDGALCYHPIDYGGCASSDVSCTEDANGVCGCGLDPDCGGAYCVPSEIFFGGASDGPTEGWLDNSCAPDDGPAFALMVGLDANTCGGESDGGPLIRFLIAQDPGQIGTYDLSAPDSSASYSAVGDLTDAEFVSDGILRIFEWDDTVVGEYEIGLADTTVLVGSFSLPYCNSDVVCG